MSGTTTYTTRWLYTACGAANMNNTHTCEKCGESRAKDAQVIKYDANNTFYAKSSSQPDISEFIQKYDKRTFYLTTGMFFRIPFIAQRTSITVNGDRLSISYSPSMNASSCVALNEIESVTISRKLSIGTIIQLVGLGFTFLLGLLLQTDWWILVLLALPFVIWYGMNYQMLIHTHNNTIIINEWHKRDIEDFATELAKMRSYFPKNEAMNSKPSQFQALNYNSAPPQPKYRTSVPPVQQGLPTPAIQKTIPEPEVNAVEEIRKYKGLLDEGIITQEEFDAKKKLLMKIEGFYFLSTLH